MDPKRNFVVTWYSMDQDGSSSGIFAQAFNKKGNTIDSEFQVNTYTESRQLCPAVAMDAIGNFIITWQSDGQDGSGYGVFAKMFKN